MGKGLSENLSKLKFLPGSHNTRNALFMALFDFVTEAIIDKAEQGPLQEIVYNAVERIGDYTVIE